ncbi:phage holin family protein [Hydrogenophaga sp. 5NK40-0174]|uniref:phage holin family protein n=1 Tax=Hydrogenophaga sp. 5NK40-0174 TaxID=3127649 RepID=UPI00310242EF
MKLILTWLLAACALLMVAYLFPGVSVQSFGSAMIAAAVIGLFNMILRPVLVILTLPVTVVTLGLFLFVINALLFWAAASILDGFAVTGFWAAMLGSLIYSAIMVVVNVALKSALGGSD